MTNPFPGRATRDAASRATQAALSHDLVLTDLAIKSLTPTALEEIADAAQLIEAACSSRLSLLAAQAFSPPNALEVEEDHESLIQDEQNRRHAFFKETGAYAPRHLATFPDHDGRFSKNPRWNAQWRDAFQAATRMTTRDDTPTSGSEFSIVQAALSANPTTPLWAAAFNDALWITSKRPHPSTDDVDWDAPNTSLPEVAVKVSDHPSHDVIQMANALTSTHRQIIVDSRLTPDELAAKTASVRADLAATLSANIAKYADPQSRNIEAQAADASQQAQLGLTPADFTRLMSKLEDGNTGDTPPSTTQETT